MSHNLIDQELRSLRWYLRRHPDCPDEVRIHEQEGAFTRPMIHLDVYSTTVVEQGARYLRMARNLAIIWYGRDDDDEDAARHAAHWISEFLTTGGIRNTGTFRLRDMDADEVLETVLTVQPETVGGNPERDAYGKVWCPFDVRYQVAWDTPRVEWPRIETINVVGVDP